MRDIERQRGIRVKTAWISGRAAYSYVFEVNNLRNIIAVHKCDFLDVLRICEQNISSEVAIQIS